MSLSQFVQLVTLSGGCSLIAVGIAGVVDMWRGRK